MVLRVIEIFISADKQSEFEEILKDTEYIDKWIEAMPNNIVHVKILVSAENSGSILNELEKKFYSGKDFRVLVGPILATLPKIEEKEEEKGEDKDKRVGRTKVSRQELYERVEESSKTSGIYVLLSILASVVGAIGILRNNEAVIIGAMVIAPFLGPMAAVAFSLTIGDLRLAFRAFKTAIIGFITVAAISALWGFLTHVDPKIPAIYARTHPTIGDLVLALAAGTAGILSLTAGLPSAIIGVMVAVSLLPPLVIAGLLFGAGEVNLGLGALILFLTNVVAINVAGIATFLIQGIKPAKWWEKNRAKRASLVALFFWIILLSFLVYMLIIW